MDRDTQTAHFNADAMAAALEVPTLTVGNLRYRGRLLSIEEWLPWWERSLKLGQELDAEKTGDKNVDAVTRALRLSSFYAEYLRVVFPKGRFAWWAPDPIPHLIAKPFSVIEEAFALFFYLQAVATFGAGQVKAMTLKALPGMPSPPPTPNGAGSP